MSSINSNPMTDSEIDLLDNSNGFLHHGRSWLADNLENFTRYADTPTAKVIQAHIGELEDKAARADQPVEAEARRGIEGEILELRRLLIDTSEGVATIDSRAPRIDLRFLKLTRFQWPYGWLPRFAVFTRESTTCSLNVTTNPSLGHVISSTCSEPLLGQFFQAKWPFQSISLLKRLLIFLMTGAVIGALGGSLLAQAPAITMNTFYGALIGIGCSSILCFVEARFKNQRVSVTLQTHLQGTLPDEIRRLLPALEAEFDEVLLIVSSNNWRERAAGYTFPEAFDTDILVVARRDDNYWLAAYRLNSRDKKNNSQMFLSILESDPRNHSRVRTLNLANNANLTDEELARHIAELEDPFDLRELYLDNTRVTDAGLAHLRGLTNLQRLSLEGTRITKAGLAHLHEVTSLRRLYLWDTHANGFDAGLPCIREQTIYVSGEDVTDEEFARHIAELEAPRDFRELTLRNTSVTNVGLASLHGLTNLQKVTLEGYKVTDACLASLGVLTNLKRLLLQDTSVTDAGLAHLPKMSRLHRLQLWAQHNNELTEAGIAHLGDLPTLREFNLSVNEITDAWLARLGSLANLHVLDVGSSKWEITDAGLAHLRNLTNLRHIEMSGPHEIGLGYFSNLTNLQSLEVSLWEINDAQLAQLCNLTSLRTLSLSSRRLGVTEVGLAHLSTLTNLAYLDLNVPACRSQITDAWLAHLGKLVNLQRLDFSGSRITDAGLAHIRGLTKLEVLNLSDTQTTDTGLAHLSALTSLLNLYLSGTQITDAGLVHLEGLRRLCRLVLAKTNITDDGLAHICNLTRLWELNLSSTKITDGGLAHLCRLTNLRQLWLGNIGIADAGIAHLGSLTNLYELSLGLTEVTDAGLGHLSGLSNLGKLNLVDTKVTKGGVKAFKESLSKRYCSVSI